MLDFYKKFFNMIPMKYYDAKDHTRMKAQDMIKNKDNKTRGFLKADGEWSRAIIMQNEVILQSRSKSTVTGEYGIKTKHVPHIAEELLANYPEGTVLLGELSFRDITKTSKDVGSILRCLVPKALDRQKETKLIFRVFDCLAYDFVDFRKRIFDERFQLRYVTPASLYQMREPMAQYIEVIEEIKGDFMEYAEDLWMRDGEGIVLIKRDMKYMAGGRKAWDTLKIKKKLGHIDVQVIGALDATVRYNGDHLFDWKYWVFDGELTLYEKGLGESAFSWDLPSSDGMYFPVSKGHFYGWKMAIEVTYKGNKIRVASGLTDEDRAYLATDAAKEAIESDSLFAVITGMELTSDSIRHPVFIDFRHK